MLLQPLASVEDRLVLGDQGDDVVALSRNLGDALMARLSLSVAPQVKTISLAVGADQLGDLLAGVLDRLLGLPAERVVPARGVAELAGEIRQHRFETRGSAGVVEWLSM